jgi:sec-independent protein translocase protein TatA
MRLDGWQIVIIIVIAILLFGAPKLPGLARSAGQSLRIFKSEVKQMKDENNTGSGTAGTPVEGNIVAPGPNEQTHGTPGQPTAAPHTPPGAAGGSHPAPGGTPGSTP